MHMHSIKHLFHNLAKKELGRMERGEKRGGRRKSVYGSTYPNVFFCPIALFLKQKQIERKEKYRKKKKQRKEYQSFHQKDKYMAYLILNIAITLLLFNVFSNASQVICKFLYFCNNIIYCRILCFLLNKKLKKLKGVSLCKQVCS